VSSAFIAFMRFGLLGPLAVWLDGQPARVGGLKQRSVLAVLLLEANGVVSRDRLIDALWGDSPPPSASAALDAYVYRLRKLVGSDRLTRRGSGYVLRVGPGELDAGEFESLVAGGRAALAAGDAGGAARQLREALALWRGPALADLAGQPFADNEIARLEEVRLGALEDRIEADLILGRHDSVVSELRALVSSHPLRERLHGQLMTALYRGGRQAAALEAYQAARRTLADEFGIDPAPALQRLEIAILRQDPALEPPGRPARSPGTPAGTRPRPGNGARHARWLAALAVGLAAASAVVATGASHGTAHLTAGPDTVG
jgi:DNA-binding SARP family transcriptional activator